jgi:hypothetical protein
MEHGNNDNVLVFDSEIDGVRKTPEKHASDTGTQMLVFEWPVSNAFVYHTKFIEELQPQPLPFILVPLEDRLNVKVGSRLGDQSILGH